VLLTFGKGRHSMHANPFGQTGSGISAKNRVIRLFVTFKQSSLQNMNIPSLYRMIA
jgi:hypothetical protein